MRDAWVAETRAEAVEVYGPEVMTAYKYYWRNGLSEFRSIGSEDEITLDNLGKDRLILGEPEECAAEFQRWSEAVGAEYFLLRLRHAHSGGPPPREDNGGDKAVRGRGHSGLRLGERPGRAQGSVSQGFRIEMTRLPLPVTPRNAGVSDPSGMLIVPW